MTHRHTFKRTIGATGGDQVLYYIHGSKCSTGGSAKYGEIRILPNPWQARVLDQR